MNTPSIPSNPSTSSGPDNRLTPRAFFRILLRVVIVLGLLALVGVVIVFGAPLAYRELVVPVRENSARLNALEQSLSADRETLLARVDDLQARLNQLEAARVSVESDRVGLQSDVDALRRDVEALTAALSRLDEIELQIGSINSWLSYSSTQEMGLQMRLQDPAGDLNTLRREVNQLKALNLLIRAQVHLAQNNFGLAREDAVLARSVLVDLRISAPEGELAQIDSWIARLDLALGNLPGFPVVAAGDLEQAYQMLAGAMLPASEQLAAGGTPTPTPATWLTETSAALTGTPTPIATPNRSVTATAIPTSTPTPFPTSTP
jgi:hypothetical protein